MSKPYIYPITLQPCAIRLVNFMRYAYFPLNVTQVFLQYSFQPALFCQRPGRILLPASVCWPAFVDLYTYVCPNFFRYVSNVYKFASFEGLFSAVSMPIVATKYLFSQRVPRFTRCEFVRIAKCSKYVIFQMVSLLPRNVGSVCKYAYLISFAIFLSKVDEIISDFHNFFKTEFQRLLRKSTK